MTTMINLSVNDVITAAPSASCDADLARGPWDFDLAPGYGPGASELDVIPEPVIRPGQLPTAYQRMSDDELHARIRTAKEKLGSELVILGHFYQRDEVVQYADRLLSLPAVPTLLQPMVTAIPLQLFACELATAKGHDVDQPRNLAKSVTVE